jgi:hypothetical protein
MDIVKRNLGFPQEHNPVIFAHLREMRRNTAIASKASLLLTLPSLMEPSKDRLDFLRRGKE